MQFCEHFNVDYKSSILEMGYGSMRNAGFIVILKSPQILIVPLSAAFMTDTIGLPTQTFLQVQVFLPSL